MHRVLLWSCVVMLAQGALASFYQQDAHTHTIKPANIDMGNANYSKTVNYGDPLFQIKASGNAWVHTVGPASSITGAIPKVSKSTIHWYTWQGPAGTAPGASYDIGAQLNGHVEISAVISSPSCPWGTGYASVSISSHADSGGTNFPGQAASVNDLGGESDTPFQSADLGEFVGNWECWRPDRRFNAKRQWLRTNGIAGLYRNS